MATPAEKSAPAADVAMWLRAGMAAKNSRGSERGESMTLLLEEEQKRSAVAATAKFELENGDAAREAVRREFEADELTKTNRQLKGMVVRLRDELKETQKALAEAQGGVDFSKRRTSGAGQPQPQASEEEFRNRTVELINHLQEQAKLSEMREKQTVAHVQQQMHELQQQLASAHRLRDVREARKWALQDWLEGHSLSASVAERVIPALEEMEIASADWIKTLETFSRSELDEFIAELPSAELPTDERGDESDHDDVIPDDVLASLPSSNPIGSSRVAKESGDFDPISADMAGKVSAASPEAAPAAERRRPSAWDGVPTADSRDAVCMLAEMGDAAPLERCRASGILAEDAHVLEENNCHGPQFANLRGASVVQWEPLSQPDEGIGLIIRTQFGEGDNLHRVSSAGSVRQQLTFFDGVALGDVSMRPNVIVDSRVSTGWSEPAAGPGACCAYAIGSDEVCSDDEVQFGAHGVYLFDSNTGVHTRLPPVIDATESLELSAHEGFSNSKINKAHGKAAGRGRVRKDCGLCWSTDGEDLVWSSSAGACTGGLDLVHWHAASGSTRRLVCASAGESLLALGFAPSRKKLLLVKRIRSVQESQLCLLDLGRGALADGSFRPAPTLRPLFERQLGARPISYGGLAGLGIGNGGAWAGASWGGVSTGSFSGVVYTSDEDSQEESAVQRLRYCVIDIESCEVVHDGLLAQHDGQSDVISVACSQQSATVAYVRTVERGSSCAIHLLDNSEISAAATAGKPLSPVPLPGPTDISFEKASVPEPKADHPAQIGVPGFGVTSSTVHTNADETPEEATCMEAARTSPMDATQCLLMTGLQFSPDGLQLAVTVQTPQTVADVHVLTTRVDVHKVRSRVWSRWTTSELGSLSAAQLVSARRDSYPSEDPWTTNEDGTRPLRIPMLVYEPRSSPPTNGWPVVLWLPDNPLTGRGHETTTSLSAKSPLSSTQGCVLDAGIQMVVREIGAAVIVPHVRGSSGYGSRYASLAKQHRREAAVKDVRSLFSWLANGIPGDEAAVEALPPKYDLQRIAVYGVGQGGFLAATVSAMLCGMQSGTTSAVQIRPRCLVLERPVTNLVTFLAETAPYLQEVLRDEFG